MTKSHVFSTYLYKTNFPFNYLLSLGLGFKFPPLSLLLIVFSVGLSVSGFLALSELDPFIVQDV
mgnify:CR=1 FL=1